MSVASETAPAQTSVSATPDFEWRIMLCVENTTALRIGSGDDSAWSDAELLRDANGTPYIPGTSIAGALRAAVEQMSGVLSEGAPKPCCVISNDPDPKTDPETDPEPCNCPVCLLFGDVRPVGTARASRVWIDDAVVESHTVVERMVDGVAIDRRTRAAADARKYDWVEVRPGARFWIEVRTSGFWPGDSLNPDERNWLGASLRLLGEGEIGLGARGATGKGKLNTLHASIWRRTFGDGDDAWLEQAFTTPWRPRAERDNMALLPKEYPGWPECVASSLSDFPGADVARRWREDSMVWRRRITTDRRTGGTLLIHDPVVAFETGFERASRGGADRAELSSDGLRGALRSGAERILRTIAASFDHASSSSAGSTGAGKAINDSAIACYDFSAHDGDCPPCLACQLFGYTGHAGRLEVAVDETDLPATRPAELQHVAIDRFTGGARAGALYDAQAAIPLAHYSATLRFSRDASMWMWGLVALALNDLDTGRITVGGSAATGHGFMRIECTHPTDFVSLEDAQAWVDALWKKVEEVCTQGGGS